MLREDERRSMLAMGRSEAVREEFRRVRAAGRRADRALSTQQLLDFLTTMTRLTGRPLPPRPFVRYTNVRL